MSLSFTTSRFAIAAASGLLSGGLALTPAQAADLGGDCCADLEERVAELEATTVRKGNRKVSVKLSGQVNRAVVWWDDGDEENVYVVDNDYSSTRFRFTGDANWKPGWKIGFALEWEQQDEASNVVRATNDDVNGGFNVRQAHWWVKSDRLGKIRVGQISTASDAVSEVNLSGATVVSGSLIGATIAGFGVVGTNAATPTGSRGTAWSAWLAGNLDGLGRQDGVRYDSPTFAGFTLSAGWYEDDMWDVALRFAKQWNSVLFAAAIGYAENREGATNCNTANGVNAQNGGGDDADCERISGSASILHQPTGLFATFAAGEETDNNRDFLASRGGFTGPGDLIEDESSFWYVNVGVNRRFNAYGKTSVGVEFYQGECGLGACSSFTGGSTAGGVFNLSANALVAGTEVDAWGAWIVQNIDSAATEFYVGVHSFDLDIDWFTTTGAAVTDTDPEDITTVTAGARIKF